jgi:two-component system chemotaxis response regulator CheY/two-component system response regulator (stage 0 sporulation protein A)
MCAKTFGEIDPNSVVIMIATDISEDTPKRMEDLKAAAVVYKPFEINELVKIVNDIESNENIGQIEFFN